MNSNSLLINSIKQTCQLINYQTVRWRRPTKPFWLGVAKSKRFLIPQPRVTRTPKEKAQNLILNHNYRVELKSLLNFIRTSDPKLTDLSSHTDVKGKLKNTAALEIEISKSYENNAAWNAESARRRDERLKNQRERSMDSALKIIQFKEEKNKKEMELMEEVVRKEKILSMSYITPENLDEAVENCLNNVENFDFAIDLKGNRFPGSKTLSSSREKAESETSTA